MKIFIGLVLTLLIQKAAFAQPELPSSSSKDTSIQVQKTIDSLNVAAFNIYLGSPDIQYYALPKKCPKAPHVPQLPHLHLGQSQKYLIEQIQHV
jgi:hypothetical protein